MKYIKLFEQYLNEATIRLDALEPDSKYLKKLLKKHNVEMQILDYTYNRPGGIPEVELTGKKEDLKKVISDDKYGWGDPDLEEYIEEGKIKLYLPEGKILEFTEYEFDPMDMYSRSTENAKAVEKALKKAGFSKVNLAKAQKQVRNIDLEMDKSRGVMFVHVQYHVIETKDGKKLFIHQTQYYHSAWETGGVNLTALYVTERPHWPESDVDIKRGDYEKEIGRAVVLTDDFLDGLRKANVIDRAS